jgi:hypothetical protein
VYSPLITLNQLVDFLVTLFSYCTYSLDGNEVSFPNTVGNVRMSSCCLVLRFSFFTNVMLLNNVIHIWIKFHHIYRLVWESYIITAGAGGSSVSIVLTSNWTTRVRFAVEVKDFWSSLCVQTGSGAHPASYPVGTGGPFLGVKCGRGVTLTTHPI